MNCRNGTFWSTINWSTTCSSRLCEWFILPDDRARICTNVTDLFISGKQKASTQPSLALVRIQLQAVDDTDAGVEGSDAGGDEDEEDRLSGKVRLSDDIEGEVSDREGNFEDRGSESGGYKDERNENGGYNEEDYNDAVDEDGGYKDGGEEDGHDEIDSFEDGGYNNEDDGHNGGRESDGGHFAGVFGAGGLEHRLRDEEGSDNENDLHDGERARAENSSDGED